GFIWFSERGRLVRRGIPPLGIPLAQRVVQELPSFAGNAGSTLYRTAKTVELTSDVIERRLHLTPQLAAVLSEKQVACCAANYRTNDCCNNRSVFHIDLRARRLGVGNGPTARIGRKLKAKSSSNVPRPRCAALLASCAFACGSSVTTSEIKTHCLLLTFV